MAIAERFLVQNMMLAPEAATRDRRGSAFPAANTAIAAGATQAISARDADHAPPRIASRALRPQLPPRSMRPVLIAGPTASGKSALAVELARRLGGVIVNADSQQVYREWRVLTARPSADEAEIPHRLYGHVGVAEPYSVGRWLHEVGAVLSECAARPPRPSPAQPSPTRGKGAQTADALPDPRQSSPEEERAAGRVHTPGSGGGGQALEGRDGPDIGVPSPLRGEDQGGGVRPIIVGGTGLYFKALTEGLAPIPDVPAEVRAAGEAELQRVGLARFAERLAARDGATVAMLDLSNPRRVLRAWEVLEATGLGLAAWKARTPPPLVPLGACTAIALDPPRPWLHARCEARLDAMLAAGALDEVAQVMAMRLPSDAPALKAVGAAELAAHLGGRMTLAEAAAGAKAGTRRYAKRQLTWMRNQMAGWTRLDPSGQGAAERAIALVAG